MTTFEYAHRNHCFYVAVPGYCPEFYKINEKGEDLLIIYEDSNYYPMNYYSTNYYPGYYPIS